MYRGCDEYSGVKDEEADAERALPRGARHPADYVMLFAVEVVVAEGQCQERYKSNPKR